MKNSIKITIILLFYTSSFLYSQNYVPFPEEKAYWTVREFDFSLWDGVIAIYTLKGDTTINEKQYNKVYRLTEIPDSKDTLWTLHCLMRQEVDKKKIYFVRTYQGEIQEKLGYDFDVNIGDTISLPAFDYANIGDSLFVVELAIFDSTLLWNGESRKNYFYASIIQNGSFDLQIIEGIGEYKSPFPNILYWDPFHQSEMTCLDVDDEYLYGFTSDPSENCGFNFLSTNESNAEYKITITPNPANKLLLVKPHDAGQKLKEFHIINSLGIEVYFERLQNQHHEYYTIDISTLPNGIYFIIVKSANAGLISEKLIINH